MKTRILLAIFLLLGITAFAQKQEVPAAVKNKFATLYPDVKSAEWEKEGANYEAEFKVDKMETTVVFDAAGNLLATETEIPVDALPQGAKDFLAKTAPGKKITEAVKIVAANGTVSYEAEADDKDFLFDANGNFTGTEAEEGEDDKD